MFVDHRRQPDHRDDGVQDKRQEEVLVEGYPLTAETPEDNMDTVGMSRTNGLKHVFIFSSDFSCPKFTQV